MNSLIDLRGEEGEPVEVLGVGCNALELNLGHLCLLGVVRSLLLVHIVAVTCIGLGSAEILEHLGLAVSLLVERWLEWVRDRSLVVRLCDELLKFLEVDQVGLALVTLSRKANVVLDRAVACLNSVNGFGIVIGRSAMLGGTRESPGELEAGERRCVTADGVGTTTSLRIGKGIDRVWRRGRP